MFSLTSILKCFYFFLILPMRFNSFSFHFRIYCQDCRAGLNFCDELEAFAFRAAIKERIKDFKRKRQGKINYTDLSNKDGKFEHQSEI